MAQTKIDEPATSPNESDAGENILDETQEKRLDFILKQAEIYAHFMAKGGGTPPKIRNDPKKKNPSKSKTRYVCLN